MKAALLYFVFYVAAVGGGSTAKKADVNEDGKVNGTDIQEVINIIVNAE